MFVYKSLKPHLKIVAYDIFVAFLEINLHVRFDVSCESSK